MSYQTFRQSVHDFLPYLVKVNLYDEGEPLLNPNLIEMIRHLSDNGVSACVSSNFSLPLTDEFLTEMIESGLEHLIIAVDGASPESYSRYRTGGDFHLVVNNLRRLMYLISQKKKCPLRVEIQYIDFDNDVLDRDAVHLLAKELGVWRCTVIQGSSRQGWEGTRFRGTAEARRLRGCYQLWITATIDTCGEVGVCDYGQDHGMPALGLASGFLREGMRNHPLAVKLRRSFRHGSPAMHDVCRHCSLYAKQG
jgi:hypothetical protein